MNRSIAAATLATKLGFIGTILLLLALGSISLTLSVTWQLEGGAAAVNEAGRLRMQTWRLAQSVNTGQTDVLGAYVQAFDESLVVLKAGDPSRPLFVPLDPESQNTFATVQSHWQGTKAAWSASAKPTPAQVATQATILVADIDHFVAAIETRLSRWTALLTLFQLGLMALAIAGGVTLLYAAHLFVFNPLSRLQNGLAQVEKADFSARIAVESHDEFGQVAEGFNRMAGTMQSFYQDLENKVIEKTHTLDAERQRLAVLYEASRFVAQTPTLQTLADGFAQRLRQAVKADASVLRWFDSNAQSHLMLASDCLPAELREQEGCLPVGNCHCGQTDAQGSARVIRIQTLEEVAAATSLPAPQRLCQRLGFNTLITVPITVHKQLLGEADLLFRSDNVNLQNDDRHLLESLAAQLASGMESLRAAALEREAAVSEERGLLARELHDSIAQGLAFMKIQVQLLRTALKRGNTSQTEHAITELDNGVRESTADVRELLLHFRTRTNSDDMVQALKVTLQKFQHQTGINTDLQVNGHGLPLPPDVQVQLLHVVQEALSNVRKHAKASQVWLRVDQQPAWTIEVRDNGVGLAPGAASPDETHVGLRIMRERAASVGAQVSIESTPGQGAHVRLTLPPLEVPPLSQALAV